MGVIINPMISWNGLATFVTTSDTKAPSGKYPYTNITTKNADATFQVNNNNVTVGNLIWDNTGFNLACVAYGMYCGSVVSIPMSVAATAGYTAPTATADADSLAKGLVISSDILPMDTGIVGYTNLVGGSGYAGSWAALIPGGNPSGPSANVWITVVNGAVTAITPLAGYWFGYGIGYANTFDTSLDGNGGTGCKFTVVVGNYIRNIPVLKGGSGLLIPPTITIIDSTGAGAVAAPIMSGPMSSDIVTYSAPDGWLITSAGSVAGATNAQMFNYFGRIEGSAVSLSGFDIARTMKVGGQHPPQSSYSQEAEMFTGKDRMFCSEGWKGSNVTLDANLNPVSWDPGGTITNGFFGTSTRLACLYQGGPWTIKYIDNSPPGVTTSITITGAGGVYTVGPVNSPTVSGNLVIIEVPITLQWSPGGWLNCLLALSWTSSDGLNHVVHPNNPNVFRPLVMAPGNTDRGLYYDADDNVINNLTGQNGETPADIRGMDTLWGYAGINNFCTLNDKMPSNFSIWGNSSTQKGVQFQFVRRLNTDPNDKSVPWISTKIYNPQGWIPTGTDDLGIYFNIADGPFGASDNGRVLLQNPNNTNAGIVELRTTTPGGHGLKTGHTCLLYPNNKTGYTIPWTIRGSVDNTFYPGFYLNIGVVVTGIDTVAFQWSFSTPPTGTGPDTINSNVEIAADIVLILTTPVGSTVPTEYLATFVSRLPNTRLWMNLPSIGTNQHDATGYNYSEGYTCAKILGPTNGVDLEMGNEPWNWGISTFSYYFQLIQANWAAYAPQGTKIYGGYATADGQPTPNSYIGVNVYASAQAFDAFIAGWVAGGRSASDVKRMLSSGWGFSGITNADVVMAQAALIPVDGVIVAPYVTLDNITGNSSIIDAFQPAGYPIGTSQNLHVGQLNDLQSFYTVFNIVFQAQWASHAQYTNAAGIPLIAYEGGYQSLTPYGMYNKAMISQDMFSHSSFGAVIKRLMIWAQEGDRTRFGVGAGVDQFNYYCLYYTVFGDPQWALGDGPIQPTGPGLNNLFFTPQGGMNDRGILETFAQGNQAVGINEILNFNAPDSPVVISILPIASSSVVLITSPISATFNQAIQPATLSVTFTDSTGTVIPCTTTYNNNTVTITPTISLVFNMTYTATIVAAIGNSNIPMRAPFSWSFTTAADPTVNPLSITSVSPIAGASNIPITTTAIIVFNQAIIPSTIGVGLMDSTGTNIPCFGAYNNNTFTLTPQASLVYEMTYTITANATASNSNTPMSVPFIWSFTTAVNPVTTPLAVTSVSPTDGSTNIPITTTVSVTFNQAVQPLTLGVAITDPTGVQAKCTGTYANNIMTITPIAPLAYDTIYIGEANAIAVGSTTPMDKYFTWSFTTEADPTINVPTVSSISPTDGSVNVPITTSINVIYNQAYQPGTFNITITDPTGAAILCNVSNFTATGMTITPMTPLTYNTVYAVSTYVTSSLGVSMSTPFTWSFTTVPNNTYTVSIDTSNTIKYQPVTITVTINTTFTGTVDFTDSSEQGLFYPALLTFDGTQNTQNVMYIPGSVGPRTITVISTPTLINYTIDITTIPGLADSFTLTASNGQCIITPNGFYTGTIFLFDVSVPFLIPANGSFTPPFLIFSNSSVAQSFSYTANTPGKKIIYAVAFPSIGMNKPITLEI